MALPAALLPLTAPGSLPASALPTAHRFRAAWTPAPLSADAVAQAISQGRASAAAQVRHNRPSACVKVLDFLWLCALMHIAGALDSCMYAPRTS